jgi:hypothetical protein
MMERGRLRSATTRSGLRAREGAFHIPLGLACWRLRGLPPAIPPDALGLGRAGWLCS